jgi:hypothetical protein
MLKLCHGNTYELTYNIKNSDGSIKVLDGTTVLKYEISKRVNSAPLLQFTSADPELDITAPTSGIITIKLDNTTINTLKDGTHYHELWQVNAVGDPTTLMAEKIQIQEKLITN